MSIDYTPEGNASVALEDQSAAPKRGRKPNARPAEQKQRRRRRSDLGLGRLAKLDVPAHAKDPNYVYRWINDTPGRVKQLTEQDDYDIVTSDMLGERSDSDRGSGQNVERDAGGGMRAILVRKPREYYEQDKAAEQKLVDEIDDALRRGQTQSPEGLSGPHSYVPEGGININDGRKS